MQWKNFISQFLPHYKTIYIYTYYSIKLFGDNKHSLAHLQPIIKLFTFSPPVDSQTPSVLSSHHINFTSTPQPRMIQSTKISDKHWYYLKSSEASLLTVSLTSYREKTTIAKEEKSFWVQDQFPLLKDKAQSSTHMDCLLFSQFLQTQ